MYLCSCVSPLCICIHVSSHRYVEGVSGGLAVLTHGHRNIEGVTHEYRNIECVTHEDRYIMDTDT